MPSSVIWVQCDRCKKWRYAAAAAVDKNAPWDCSMNVAFDAARASCTAPEVAEARPHLSAGARAGSVVRDDVAGLASKIAAIRIEHPAAFEIFSCAGGATYGLHLAGFKTVVSMDVDEQPHHPRLPGVHFIRADARALRAYMLRDFDFVWASPPCQSFSQVVTSVQRATHQNAWRARGEQINLIPFTRALLRETGKPYTIENVPGARTHLEQPRGGSLITLCGTMFPNLAVFRRRYFEIGGMRVRAPTVSCPTKGFSVGERTTSVAVKRPKTERMVGDIRAAIDQFAHVFRGRATRFVPKTAKAREAVRAFTGGGSTEVSAKDALRALGVLVPLTPDERAAEVARYAAEKRAHNAKREAREARRVERGEPPPKQMFPVYGRNASDTDPRGSLADWRAAMGISWMQKNELREAIPPAYSRFIGKHAIALIAQRQK